MIHSGISDVLAERNRRMVWHRCQIVIAWAAVIAAFFTAGITASQELWIRSLICACMGVLAIVVCLRGDVRGQTIIDRDCANTLAGRRAGIPKEIDGRRVVRSLDPKKWPQFAEPDPELGKERDELEGRKDGGS